jgi:hypothetical protein
MTVVNDDQAFGYINAMAFKVQFVPNLADESVVDRAADDLINQISFMHPVEEFYDALAYTVGRGRIQPQALEIVEGFHTEPELLAFFARLVARLDELKPWPKPRFLKRDISVWETFSHAKAIAQITAPETTVVGRLNNSFDRVPAGTGMLPVIVLELRTGETVAIVGSADPRSTVFTLMQRDPGDPDEVVEHFRELAGFPPDEVERLR